MSGPIVRKYGFPNFEKIFGERPSSTEWTNQRDASSPSTGDEKPSGSNAGCKGDRRKHRYRKPPADNR